MAREYADLCHDWVEEQRDEEDEDRQGGEIDEQNAHRARHMRLAVQPADRGPDAFRENQRDEHEHQRTLCLHHQHDGEEQHDDQAHCEPDAAWRDGDVQASGRRGWLYHSGGAVTRCRSSIHLEHSPFARLASGHSPTIAPASVSILAVAAVSLYCVTCTTMSVYE